MPECISFPSTLCITSGKNKRDQKLIRVGTEMELNKNYVKILSESGR